MTFSLEAEANSLHDNFRVTVHQRIARGDVHFSLPIGISSVMSERYTQAG